MEISFHRNLKSLIRQQGTTTAALARAIGCSPKTVSDWLAGGRTPRDLRALRRCARHFGVTLHFLIFGEEDACAPGVSGTLKLQNGYYDVTLRRVKSPERQ